MCPTFNVHPSATGMACDFGASVAHVDAPFAVGTQPSSCPVARRDDCVPYARLVAALHDVARRIDIADPQAEGVLGRLLAELNEHPDSRCVGLLVFAAGLARRLAGAAVGQANLYLSRFELPQIHLFNLLGRAVPFVGLATQLSNQAIMQAIAHQDSPTLIDVGIGTGRQACLLLDSLAQAGRLPRLLTVIGIEPSDWALDEARQTIEQTAERLGANLSFFGIVGKAEQLTPSDWRRIAQACTARPVVNASFALHHIADAADGSDLRDGVLAQLRRLNPECLVLAEPDVDHLEPHFFSRFVNCFRHFAAVFETLDKLPLDAFERDALKAGFFGREIADILGSPDGLRSERHESAAAWMRRLRAAGFDLSPMAQSAFASPDDRAVVTLQQRQGHMSLDAFNVPVVALFVARPETSPAAEAPLRAEALVY